MLHKNTILTQFKPILADIEQQNFSSIWIGYSGGMDSTVLLHTLATLDLPFAVNAIHINHQLSLNADHWQAHCESFARLHNVNFVAEKVEVKSVGGGLEEAAREKRFQAFAKHVSKSDALLLGHHQDDQFETFLFRLLRGAGITGLSGIKTKTKLGDLQIYRPFLNLSRNQLKAYADEQKLRWIEDESNDDPSFDRNYLRVSVVPALKQRWPNLLNKWQQTQNWLNESTRLLEEYGLQDLKALDIREERLGQSIDLVSFRQFSESRQKQVMRIWVSKNGYSLPDSVHLNQIDVFFNSSTEKQPSVNWGQCELRRYENRLYLIPRLSAPTFKLEHIHNVTISLDDGSFLRLPKVLLDHNVHIGFRQEGLRCKPILRHHSQTLKKLLQEHHLEPWLRDRIPLIYVNDELIAIGNLFLCESSFSNKISLNDFAWWYVPSRPFDEILFE